MRPRGGRVARRHRRRASKEMSTMSFRSVSRPLHTMVLLVLFAAACSSPAPPSPSPPSPSSRPFPEGELVDLSHAYDDTTIFWPTSERFRLEKTADGITPQGYYYASNDFFTAEHGGTHLDAPLHFAQGAQAVDQIPLERFVGPAVVVDVV